MTEQGLNQQGHRGGVGGGGGLRRSPAATLQRDADGIDDDVGEAAAQRTHRDALFSQNSEACPSRKNEMLILRHSIVAQIKPQWNGDSVILTDAGSTATMTRQASGIGARPSLGGCHVSTHNDASKDSPISERQGKRVHRSQLATKVYSGLLDWHRIAEQTGRQHPAAKRSQPTAVPGQAPKQIPKQKEIEIRPRTTHLRTMLWE